MGHQTHVRWAVWGVTVVLAFAMVTPAAYASDKPRVEAAGWYFGTSIMTNNQEIKIGVTGKCDRGGTFCSGGHDLGRFEYFNTVTGLRVHGKINTIQFHPQSCPNVPLDSTFPAVTVNGSCDDGSCSFAADLVDGGNRKNQMGDWVCNVNVAGQNKSHALVPAENEDAQRLQKGEIKIRDYQP